MKTKPPKHEHNIALSEFDKQLVDDLLSFNETLGARFLIPNALRSVSVNRDVKGLGDETPIPSDLILQLLNDNRETAIKLIVGETYNAPDDMDGIARQIRRFLAGAENSISAEAGIERIVRLTLRPSILIRNNSLGNLTAIKDLITSRWADRLNAASSTLSAAIRAVGMIEMKNHPREQRAGTAALIAPEILVTNFHVAEMFCDYYDTPPTFRVNPATNKTITPWIDFREEDKIAEEAEFDITKVLAFNKEQDLALLQVTGIDPNVNPPLVFASEVKSDNHVALIGYPTSAPQAIWGREAAAKRIFGGKFNVKRLAPGEIMSVGATDIVHDCTTLPGNSGSPLIDVSTGELLGVHYYGKNAGNLARPVNFLKDLLREI